MKHKISLILIPTIVLLFLASCGKGDTGNEISSVLSRFFLRDAISQASGVSSTTSTLPSNVTVSVPRSIRSSSSGTSASVLAQRALQSLRMNSRAKANTAPGFKAINDFMAKLLAYTGETKYEFLILDKLFNSTTSYGVCIPGDQQVQIPQAALDTVMQSFLTLGLTQAEAEAELALRQSEGTLPKAGKSVYIPAYKINKLENDPIGFEYEILYKPGATVSTSSTCPDSDAGFTKFLRFNTAQTLVQYTMKKTLQLPGLNISVTPVLFLDKSGTKPKTVLSIDLVIDQSDRKSKVTEKTIMQQCNETDDETTRCRKISFEVETKNPPAPGSTTVSSSYDTKIEVAGQLSNKGGFIKTTVIDNSTGTKKKSYTKEVFNENQELIAKQTSSDGRTWKDEVGTLDLTKLGDSLGDDTFSNFSGFGMGEQVFLEFSSALTSAISGDTSNSLYQIVLGSKSPSQYSDPNSVIVGDFFAYDEDGSGTITTKDIFINYWGTVAQISSLTIWKVSYDTSWNPTYTQITGNTLQQATTNPFANPSSPHYDPLLIDYSTSTTTIDPATMFGPVGNDLSATCYQWDNQGKAACESNSLGLSCIYSVKNATTGYCDPKTDMISLPSTTVGGTYCSAYSTDSTGCNWDSTCYWNGSGCVSTGATAPGATCFDYWDQAGCTGATTLGCKWDSYTDTVTGTTSGYCYNPAGGVSCASYVDSATCATDTFCKWDTATFTCIDSGGSGCYQWDNTDITTCEQNTNGIACVWDGTYCNMPPTTGTGTCSSYTSTTCLSAYDPCRWDGVNFQCLEITAYSSATCSTITDATQCAEEPYCYYTGSSCEYSTDCNTIDINSFGTGMGSLKDIACNSASGLYGCYWDGTSCTSGYTDPCSEYTSLTDCASDTNTHGSCNWNGSSCYTDGVASCSSHTTEPTCITPCMWENSDPDPLNHYCY